jgi:hypothetical protein
VREQSVKKRKWAIDRHNPLCDGLFTGPQWRGDEAAEGLRGGEG